MRYVLMIVFLGWLSLITMTGWLFWVTFNTYRYIQWERDHLPICVEADHHYDLSVPTKEWIEEYAPLITDEEIEQINNK